MESGTAGTTPGTTAAGMEPGNAARDDRDPDLGGFPITVDIPVA